MALPGGRSQVADTIIKVFTLTNKPLFSKY